MGCGASAEAGAVPSTLSSYGQKQRERLVAELWGLSPSVRRKRAEACGASDAEVDVAEDDAEDPKGAMVDLILKYEFEPGSAKTEARKAARSHVHPQRDDAPPTRRERNLRRTQSCRGTAGEQAFRAAGLGHLA